ncbi:hypothetical protein BOTBODRAFT_139518, partial [Botryobasidium botryosum FD-172 SS1]
MRQPSARSDDDYGAGFGQDLDMGGTQEPPDNFEMSHEGGDLQNNTPDDQNDAPGQWHYVPDNEWGRRQASWQLAWDVQIDDLADAYMACKGSERKSLATTHEAACRQDAAPLYFEFDAISMHARQDNMRMVINPDDKHANVALLQHGYLSNSPQYCSVAFAIDTLELFRRCQRRCPQFSIQAFAQVICDLHGTPFTPHLRQQFSDAFDIYSIIRQKAQSRVNAALGHDKENYRMKTSCPSCQYKLENEEELEYGMFFLLDGGNSCKRRDRAGSPRDRPFENTYFIPAAEVDRFKDDVKGKKKAQSEAVFTNPTSLEEDDGSEEWVDVDEEGDPTDGDAKVSPCAARWKAAGKAGKEKGMWDMYEETGLFVAICRHGFVLTVCDMIRSGELAKYGIALVNKLQVVFGERHRLAGAYDIWCSFKET